MLQEKPQDAPYLLIKTHGFLTTKLGPRPVAPCCEFAPPRANGALRAVAQCSTPKSSKLIQNPLFSCHFQQNVHKFGYPWHILQYPTCSVILLHTQACLRRSNKWIDVLIANRLMNRHEDFQAVLGCSKRSLSFGVCGNDI